MMETDVTYSRTGSTIPMEQDTNWSAEDTTLVIAATLHFAREQDVHKAQAAASVDDALQVHIRSLNSLGQHSKVLTAERKLSQIVTTRTLTSCFQFIKAFCHYNRTTLTRSFAKLRKWSIANKFLRSDERSRAGSTDIMEQLETHTASTRAKLVYKTPVKSVSVKKKPFRPSGPAIALVQRKDNVVNNTAHMNHSNAGSTPTATRDASRSYIQKKYYTAISPESVENVDSQHSNACSDAHNHDTSSVCSTNTRTSTYTKPIAEVRALHSHPVYRHLQRLPSTTHEHRDTVHIGTMQSVWPSRVAARSAAGASHRESPQQTIFHDETVDLASSSPEFRAANDTFAATVARTARWRDSRVPVAEVGSTHSGSSTSTHTAASHSPARPRVSSEPSTPTAVPSPSTPLRSAHTSITSPFTPQYRSPSLTVSASKSVTSVNSHASPSAAELAYARSRGSGELDLSVLSVSVEESTAPFVQPSVSPVQVHGSPGAVPLLKKAGSPVLPPHQQQHQQHVPSSKLLSRLALSQSIVGASGATQVNVASTSIDKSTMDVDHIVNITNQNVPSEYLLVGRKPSKLQALLSSQWKQSAASSTSGISNSVVRDMWAATPSPSDVLVHNEKVTAKTAALPARARQEPADYSYFAEVAESESTSPPSKHYKYLKFRAFTDTILNTQERRTAEMQVTMQCVEHYYRRGLQKGLAGLQRACVQARQRALYRHDEFSTRNQALSKAFWRLRRLVTQRNAARYRQHRSARYHRLVLLSQGLSCLAAFALYSRQRYEIHIIPDDTVHADNHANVKPDIHSGIHDEFDSDSSSGSYGDFSPVEGGGYDKLQDVQYESPRSDTGSKQDEDSTATADIEVSLTAMSPDQKHAHMAHTPEVVESTLTEESSPVPRPSLNYRRDTDIGAVEEISPLPLPRAPLNLSDVLVPAPTSVLRHLREKRAAPAVATPLRPSPSQESPTAHSESAGLPPLPLEDYSASPLGNVNANQALVGALSPSPEPERRPPHPHPPLHSSGSHLTAPYSPPSPILPQYLDGSPSTLPPLPLQEASFSLENDGTPLRNAHSRGSTTEGVRDPDTVSPLSRESASDSPASLPFYTSPVADDEPPPLPETDDSLLGAPGERLGGELRGTPESSGDDLSLFLSDDSECSEGSNLEEYYAALYPVPLSPYPVPAPQRVGDSGINATSPAVVPVHEEYPLPPLPPSPPAEMEVQEFNVRRAPHDVLPPHHMNAHANDPAMAEAEAYYRRTKLLLGLYAFNQWVLRSQAITAMNDILAQFRRLHCMRKTLKLLKAQAIL